MALNRVTLITFHDGSKQEYAYDSTSGSNYGIGRLTGITERDLTREWVITDRPGVVPCTTTTIGEPARFRRRPRRLSHPDALCTARPS